MDRGRRCAKGNTALWTQVRRKEHIDLFEDLIGDRKTWPVLYRKLIIEKEHLSFNDRFRVTTFLLANGVSPELITDFYEDIFIFDNQAKRQLDHIFASDKYMSWNCFLSRRTGASSGIRSHR